MAIPISRPPIRAVTFDETGQALNRLMKVAEGDSGGSVQVRNFLLAWWRGPLSSFNLFEIFGSVDPEDAEDIMTVIAYLQRSLAYPSEWGHREWFESRIDD